jgi:response regulator RpfG family c-di-GMP phosphodiesterase
VRRRVRGHWLASPRALDLINLRYKTMLPLDSAESPKGLVLVLDDEPLITEYVGMFLRQAGYDVLTAANAQEAWAVF